MQTPTQTERQALDAAINRTTRRAPQRPESTALPHPYLPSFENDLIRRLSDDEHRLFWLAAWQRDQGEAEALQLLHASQFVRRQAVVNPTLQHATFSSERLMANEAQKSLNNLVIFGGLLFAWHGTTALHAHHRPAYTPTDAAAVQP